MQVQKKQSDDIWYRNPTILFSGNRYKLFFPNELMSSQEILNSIMRFSIYLFIILALVNDSLVSIAIPIVVGIASWFLHNFAVKHEYYFEDDDIDQQDNHRQYGNTLPSKDNPFMNTLLTDLSTGKPRELASDPHDPCVQKMIEYNFNENLYKEADDLYNTNNSQNRFVTMPNTNEYGIASGDTVKFANWLYNPPAPTCKEDSSYCTNNYSAFNTFDNRL